MNVNWRNNGLYLLVGWALLAVACQSPGTSGASVTDSTALNQGAHQGHNHQTEAQEYTCPMHPQIVQDKPGSCPICGMDLVKKTASAPTDTLALSGELKTLLQPTNSVVVANMATVAPQRRAESVDIQANGILTYDTRRLYTVPARFSGRIEKLYVRYNYQRIRKGQKLLELYSPDMVTAQRELLFVLESEASGSPLIAAAQQKLQLLGLTEGQIQQLIRTRKPSYALAVYSPYDGYVLEESTPAPAADAPVAAGMAASNAAGGMSSDGMSSGTDAITFPSAPVSGGGTPGSASSLFVREGQYVQAGQRLFRVVDPSRLWAEFRLYARDASGIKPGDPVKISFDSGGQTARSARVDVVVPFIENGGQFVTIRAYLTGRPNERIGQLARAVIHRPAVEAFWLPATAVLDLGNQQVAFVRAKGASSQAAFTPVRVQTGARTGDQIAITRGLQEDQEVARNAQFLIDSESFVNLPSSQPQP